MNPETQTPESPYTHLHVHSEYSLLDGSIRLKELLKTTKERGQKAVALTDHGNLFGAIEFYLAAKGQGLKPIIGSEIFLSAINENTKQSAFHLVLLAKDVDGYKNLIKIVSSGYLEGLREIPLVPRTSLEKWGKGLVALTSCEKGELGHLVSQCSTEEEIANSDEIKNYIDFLRSNLDADSSYIELIDNNLPEQKNLLKKLRFTSKHFNMPLVATADAHYLGPKESYAHAVLLGIKHGYKMTSLRGRYKYSRFHLLSDQEFEEIYKDYPEALANQQKIVDQCNVEFKFGEYFLPQIDLGTNESSADALRRISKEMLDERFEALAKVYGESFDEQQRELYRKRLDYELDVIIGMGFPGYFLIVQDFINWAKKHNIPVGPGRGSGAGSLVAYALRITDLDPIPYNLLFERFLNPERVSMPDFDVDFCQDRRDEVIQYVNRRYGAEQVAQITTFGKMNAKAVIRDVGRVLELSYGRVDKIAKLIPDDLGITLEEALAAEPRLTEEARNDDTIAELLKLARQLEGLSRHTSVHAAGLVISDGPMTNFVPVYKTEDENAGLITQFDMKKVETVGLVKFDFLGLKTLTVIQKAVELIHEKHDPNFDIAMIPMDDRKVFKLVCQGHSVGIFQLESTGMRQLNLKLQPSCFEDIIAVVALFRPGPLGSGMVDSFIERKHGRETITYPHPNLEDILKETYGTILYQEQVMKIAQVLANYSLGEADLLRRAMGKKIAAEMEKQKSRFISGAIENKIPESQAAEIFDLMAEFAKYGFNKSHSAAYGLISYQTAYLKAHYPEQFMAAIMTLDLDNTSKIIRYIDECRRMKIKILPIDINRSQLEFDVPDKRTIGFGMLAIKGIGEQALEPLISEREQNGPYASLSELARRVNLQKVGKKTLELLTQVGALDGFGLSRPKLMEIIKDIVKFSENHHNAQASGQGGLFDEEPEQDDALGELNWELTPAEQKIGAPNTEWVQFEKKLTGIYLTAHPLDFHKEDLRLFSHMTSKSFPQMVGKHKVQFVGVLAMLNERITKSGNRMASLRLEDQHGYIEGVMFQNDIPEEYPSQQALVVATGSVDKTFHDNSVRYKIEKIETLDEMRAENIRRAVLHLKAPLEAKQKDVDSLINLIKQHPGDVHLEMNLQYEDVSVVVDLPKTPIELSEKFLGDINYLPFENINLELSIR